MDQNQHDQPAEGISHPTQGANDQSQEIFNQTMEPTIPQTQTVDPSSYPGRQQYTPVIPQFMYQLQQGYLEQQLSGFWASKSQEIEETTDFRTHTLPLARIKKIMKGDEDVSMVSAEAPMLFAKASEMFIQELTMRAWVNADIAKRRTLLQSDIMSAISGSDMYDFLIDIVPKVDPENYVDIVPRDDTMKQQLFAGIPYQHVAGIPYQHVAGLSSGTPTMVTEGLSSDTPTMVTAGLSSDTPTMVTAGLSSATPTMVTGSNVPDQNHDGQQTPFFPAAMMRSPREGEEEEDNHSPDLDD